MYFTAVLEKEGKRTLIDFPDCPGASTFAEPDEDVVAVACEALESWLEAELIQGEVPPRPAADVSIPRGAKALPVEVGPTLATRLQVRWARTAAGVSQGELARRMGVSRQLVSKIESAGSNVTVETIDRVAKALGVPWSINFG
jgi:DNA-binding XRE family transcriptional regulator/predicted RNase H-like HicB family nuclease